MTISRFSSVPVALQQRRNWVLWRDEVVDGRPTKIPYVSDGLHKASTQDPQTWTEFAEAVRSAEERRMGVGFVFTGSGFAGIDFDGCRNPETGKIDDWAMELIRALNSYSEVSPSRCGVKVFVRGKLPGPGIKAVSEEMGYGGKHRAIEMYDQGRYFTLTGEVLEGFPTTIEERDLDELYARIKGVARTELPSVHPGQGVKEGSRHEFLKRYAGKLLSVGIGAEALETELLRVNREMFNPPKEEREVRRQARDFYRRWKTSPALLLMSTKLKEKAPALVKVKSTVLSEVEVEAVDWLWSPYIPKGALTLLSGDPGVGKSFIALAVAAEVTRRAKDVIYLSVENHPRQTVRPRFNSLGGDASRVLLLQGVTLGEGETEASRNVCLQDVRILEDAIRERQAELVIIDPIQSYLGSQVDAYRSNETRPVLDGLVVLAEKYGVAFLILRHCAKSAVSRVIHKGLGSIDFTGAVRSELFAGETLEKKHAMAHIKSNVGKMGASLGYEITEADPGGRMWMGGFFRWTGESQISPSDLTESEESSTGRVGEAEEFLRTILEMGPKATKEVFKEARAAGISEITLRRAKDKLKIRSRKRFGMDTAWEWSLPEGDHREGDHSPYIDKVDLLDHVSENKPVIVKEDDHLPSKEGDHIITSAHPVDSTSVKPEGAQGDQDYLYTGNDHLPVDHLGSDKARFCVGPCRKLTWHRMIEDRWTCLTCGSKGWTNPPRKDGHDDD